MSCLSLVILIVVFRAEDFRNFVVWTVSSSQIHLTIGMGHRLNCDWRWTTFLKVLHETARKICCADFATSYVCIVVIRSIINCICQTRQRDSNLRNLKTSQRGLYWLGKRSGRDWGRSRRSRDKVSERFKMIDCRYRRSSILQTTHPCSTKMMPASWKQTSGKDATRSTSCRCPLPVV